MSHHVVLHYTPGPNWVPNRPVFEQPLQQHLAYMRRLHQQGIVLAGGPYTDHSGGLVILRPMALEEAERILCEDPAIVAGTMTASASPWHRLFDDPSSSIRHAST
ncbi:YciI family protein (plasmid) [Deinococcus sp. KNUC1210]|uniref:YciI family protein n=1 Tax=Deinococcus sp. KNUC1210 TaxID=2917691 RepID=UPI001EF0A515|nr:YciI family protein [Deinococcus sp. KNUC1210]ULH18232.1 YciI family protein [Deinococcus sp. KNUC1210]